MAADVLVLGAGGTFGHLAARVLAQRYELVATVRKSQPGMIGPNVTVTEFDARAGDHILQALLRRLKPSGLVINAIAVLASEIRIDAAADRERAIAINSIFPNRLAVIASDFALRVLHVSTDAVFPRMGGVVAETDTIGPEDLYGITKAAGELRDSHCVTLRCSVIGPPAPGRHRGLWSWLANQPQGAIIRGYTNQQWCGLTTYQLALICRNLVEKEQFAQLRQEAPVHHAAPYPVVSKFALVRALALALRPDLIVEAAEAEHAANRVLTSKYKVLDRHVPRFTNWTDSIKAASEASH